MNRWKFINYVVVVGLGVTGISVVNYLIKLPKKLTIKVIDTRLNPPGRNNLPDSVELSQGRWNLSWLFKANLIVVNPGISLLTKEIQQAIDKGIQVVGDIELFSWQVDKPVIAVTGSNGKSTVVDLAGLLAKSSGVNVAVGGNIGIPALDLLQRKVELYILEISSFQLETTSSLNLTAAAFLNLSIDHLDRYQSMEAYRRAKLRIFKNAKTCIVNGNDISTFPDDSSKKILKCGFNNSFQFKLGNYKGKEHLIANGRPVIASDSIAMIGYHNFSNVLFVLALLSESGVDYNKGIALLKSYRGLQHRCQVVLNNNGIKWVNDSKSTNVASTLAALYQLTCPGKLYLLVGGDSKNANLSALKPILKNLNVELCCFGRDGKKFMLLHSSAKLYDSINSIISTIITRIKKGDIVMLSPACSSSDQFENFMKRGDLFVELAKKFSNLGLE
ncbi:UDP-N-acetylmuramoyl-L-alanine--D-glutamate ligase [Candidatus Photodesmus anomalopis]|uniref:UDP-N-acetylmuramoylalanine--D-glutamate ligase n=1 Tax=Candidatus Photodesmus katoptron Akat1 TaxID=1236703 RepID=S3DKS8_9GAMM|nr:UDP-N-acetylmuramoyl-L-alanine--D-glutamate ligase [Candidatus Photodesmus katoptron]EPE37724.1 UDP-N-acetylmuramoylalanine--D-glutamate ligase [Candidatus Photodesmus katoptron Akat1]